MNLEYILKQYGVLAVVAWVLWNQNVKNAEYNKEQWRKCEEARSKQMVLISDPNNRIEKMDAHIMQLKNK